MSKPMFPKIHILRPSGVGNYIITELFFGT
jgi:hypothetical protein